MKFNVIDVGSRGVFNKNWSKEFIDNIITFDPLDKSGDESKTVYSRKRFHYPYAVFDVEGEFYFNSCNKYRTSSLYEIDFDVVKQTCYNTNLKSFEVMERIKVKCVRLDTILDQLKIKFDFLKVDAQGADLNVLKSAGKYLNDFKIIVIECNHLPIYKDSPLTPDIHEYLNQRDFQLIQTIKPAKDKSKVWCDRIYANKNNDKQINSFVRKIYTKNKGKL